MPTDASGTPIATQLCQTAYEYNASGTLATTTEACYAEHSVYFNFAIELLFIIATAAICFYVAKRFKKHSK